MYDASGNEVALIKVKSALTGPRRDADARLIAAAPALLAEVQVLRDALEKCLPFIDHAMDVHKLFPLSAASSVCKDAVDSARAALGPTTDSAEVKA